MKKVSVLIPVYNEDKMLPLLCPELKKVMDGESGKYEWEVLFVNDGSKDNSLRVLKEVCAKDKRLHYVSLSRNFGKENAMLAGFDYVSGDCMVIMDADLQDPPSLIPQMLEFWEQGYEDVYAKRSNRGKESSSLCCSIAYSTIPLVLTCCRMWEIFVCSTASASRH